MGSQGISGANQVGDMTQVVFNGEDEIIQFLKEKIEAFQ